MSLKGSLRRRELANLTLVVVAAVVFTIGSIALRLSLPKLPLLLNLMTTQYTLGFTLIGMLPILWMVAANDQTKVATFFLAIATGGGLMLPPMDLSLLDIAWNIGLASTITLMGIVYYRLNADVSRLPVLGVVGVLLLNFYLYGTYYLLRSFAIMGDLRLLLGIAALTVMLAGLARILQAEYQSVDAGGFSFA